MCKVFRDSHLLPFFDTELYFIMSIHYITGKVDGNPKLLIFSSS